MRAFKFHFARGESALARLDKPDWVLQYCLAAVRDHAALIHLWGSFVSRDNKANSSSFPFLSRAGTGLARCIAEKCLVFWLRANYPAIL